jgi:hypothetical protein
MEPQPRSATEIPAAAYQDGALGIVDVRSVDSPELRPRR